jgi:anionic cell wall polymer biosynthesis LytR-Cps2A-Psr (LCP) family protein
MSEQTTVWQEEADKTYFLWCADSDSKQLRFAWLVNFRLPEAEVTVCALSPDTMLSDGSETLESMLAKSGAHETAKKLEEFTGSPIDGYIGSDDESFKAMINYLGGADITVPEQVEYRGDEFTVILVKGKQNLKADSLFKYMRYLNTLGPRGKKLQSTALIEIFDGIFKPANIEKSEKLFSKLSNTLETDLTIVDYSEAKNGIKVFMQNGIGKRNIADSPKISH